jgi:hypothetical protein
VPFSFYPGASIQTIVNTFQYVVRALLTHTINPVGHTTGIIILRAASREEAVRWAEADPFHVHGYRKNTVHSLKITMTDNTDTSGK